MNKLTMLLVVLALIILLVTACRGISEPKAASVNSGPARVQNVAVEPEGVSTVDRSSSGRVENSAPADSIAGEFPAPATASITPETALVGSSAAGVPAPAIASDYPDLAKAITASGSSGAAATSTVDAPSRKLPSGGETVDLQALFAQAMASPKLMWCLGSGVGMQTLTQLSERVPTDDEIVLIQSCLDSQQDANVATSSQAASGEPAAAPPTLLDQALDSPGLMWCLAGNMGMESLLQLNSRTPTAREEIVEQMCSSDRQEIAMWDAEWPKRVDAAFAPVECGSDTAKDYPASYYSGPLIDSHLHIPQLPDDSPGGVDDGYQAPRGSESDLYDSIAEEDRPLLGRTVNIDKIACALQNEGTTKAFAFFPTFPEITNPAIDVAYRTVEKYPSLFVPFIQASANGVSTLEGTSLEVMLGVRPGFFFGFGEVGDSPTEPINPPPDDPIYTGDFEVARDHGLAVYYHVGVEHQENMARALERFPEVTFIVHGDFVRPYIDGLMNRYPNIYFTFNDIFDENIPLFRFGDKADFLSAMERDWDSMLDQAFEMYKPMIEAHPGQYMWGTDRGDIVWNYDADVAD